MKENNEDPDNTIMSLVRKISSRDGPETHAQESGGDPETSTRIISLQNTITTLTDDLVFLQYSDAKNKERGDYWKGMFYQTVNQPEEVIRLINQERDVRAQMAHNEQKFKTYVQDMKKKQEQEVENYKCTIANLQTEIAKKYARYGPEVQRDDVYFEKHFAELEHEIHHWVFTHFRGPQVLPHDINGLVDFSEFNLTDPKEVKLALRKYIMAVLMNNILDRFCFALPALYEEWIKYLRHSFVGTPTETQQWNNRTQNLLLGHDIAIQGRENTINYVIGVLENNLGSHVATSSNYKSRIKGLTKIIEKAADLSIEMKKSDSPILFFYHFGQRTYQPTLMVCAEAVVYKDQSLLKLKSVIFPLIYKLSGGGSEVILRKATVAIEASANAADLGSRVSGSQHTPASSSPALRQRDMNVLEIYGSPQQIAQQNAMLQGTAYPSVSTTSVESPPSHTQTWLQQQQQEQAATTPSRVLNYAHEWMVKSGYNNQYTGQGDLDWQE